MLLSKKNLITKNRKTILLPFDFLSRLKTQQSIKVVFEFVFSHHCNQINYIRNKNLI